MKVVSTLALSLPQLPAVGLQCARLEELAVKEEYLTCLGRVVSLGLQLLLHPKRSPFGLRRALLQPEPQRNQELLSEAEREKHQIQARSQRAKEQIELKERAEFNKSTWAKSG